MRRRIAAVLAAALACPAFVGAQEAAPAAPRFTISPFLGYAFAYNQSGTVRFIDTKGTYAAQFKRQVAGGIMPGIALEARGFGRFGLSVAGAYNRRGDETLSTDFVEVAPMFSSGSDLWFARAAVTMDLAETDDLQLHKLTGRVSVGPALVREVPAVETGRLASNAFAINGSVVAEAPLPWNGFSFRGAFEDYMAYLPRADVAVQLGRDVSGQLGHAYGTELSGGATHLYVIRGGISYRFGGLKLWP